MKINEYLDILTGQIRCKKARGLVEEELCQHIEEQKAYFTAAGLEEQEAEAAAVQDMGDPVGAGIALDRIHRPKMAWGMIGFILVLNILGAGVQYLMSLQITGEGITLGGIGRQFIFVIFGLLIMLAVCYADYSRIGCRAKEITVFLFVGMVAGRMLIGRQINGATQWLGIGGININLLIVLLLFLPLYGGIIYSYRKQGYKAFIKSLLWMLPSLTVAMMAASTVTVLILMFSMVITLSVAIYKGWFVISKKITLISLWCSVTMLPVIWVVGLWLFGAPYQSARIKAIISPPGDGGYQIEMIREILGSSRVFGKGEGSTIMLSTDFSLVFVGAYWGILAAVLLTGGVAILLARFLHISLKQKNQLGMIMAVGCISVLFTSLVFYILGNAGILPISYYCPFFTSGGSAVGVTAILMGLMLSIYRYQNVVGEPTADKTFRRV